MEYWSARSSTASSTYLREESSNVVQEVQASDFDTIKKKIKTNLASVDDALNIPNMLTEEFNIIDHFKERNFQYRLLTGSSLINLDDIRLAGLVPKDVIDQIKIATDLPTFHLSEAADILLSNMGESVPSSRKLRSIVRKSIGKNTYFDLMEMYDISSIETISKHFLNLMDSPLNPLLGPQLERTAAVNTTIVIMAYLFIDVNDVIGFKWYEVRTHITDNQKWDGVGFLKSIFKVTLPDRLV
ncbi:hypothetical protein INT47_000395, partial [Mucor saturninus]